uniref:G-patch domain-containing protein n=1 Tax=Bionectria ochroleuca TaxID=29856 RepID=A0A8H7NMT1_BIOOC
MDGATFSHPGFAKASAADYSSSDSDSEDERHIPGEDGDDFGDFNPRKRRRLGGNHKEKAALGIFGSDSEDEGSERQWKRKNLRNKGMSFVSTATRKDSEDENEEDEDKRPVLGNGPAQSDDEDEEDNDLLGTGLGFGFRKASEEAEAQLNEGSQATSKSRNSSLKTKFDGRNILGKGFVPSSANEPVLSEAAIKHASPPRNKPQPSAFSTKGKINAKSFGARMMAKMGYVEGQGLGKEGQGRNVIVEANLRPQGVGLGAVKEKTAQEREEEKRQAKMRGETIMDSDEEEKKKKRARKMKKTIAGAFDSAGSTPRRQKTKYLTAEELKTSAPGLHIPEAFTPILDMTGPGGKMLTSTSGIMTPTSGVSESSEIVEARKLVKRAQVDLLAFSEEWRSLEERKSWVELELKERDQELEDVRSDLERLQVFSTLVSQELVSATEWDQTISCLRKAAQLGSANAEVADIAVAALQPYLQEAGWDPLAEPGKYASEMKDLSSLLLKSAGNAKAVGKWDSSADHQNGVYRTHHKATTPYESLMYKIWLPQVLAAVRTWDPQDPTPMLRILENWDELLPPFVRAQLMNSIVRKLEDAVSDWNPRKRRQSHQLPHTWLFPWLQYLPPYHLDPRGTGLVADVRRKFRQLIDVWEFERGVVPGLPQWENILEEQWRPLIMSHILPSMGKYMRRNFRVDPADQEPYLPVLTGILKWRALLGTAMITEVLVQDMFPMWNAKLQEWMALEEADLGEIAEWYGWWRGIVLKDYAATDGVRHELDKGLRIMNTV